MRRIFGFFKNRGGENKTKKEPSDKEVKLPVGEFSSNSKVKIKNEAELKFIPKDKLFISESGYAYDVDDIISRLTSRKALLSSTPGFIQGAKGILCDYKNTEAHDDFREKNLYFEDIDLERNTIFSASDMQRLCQFPQIKEALIQACKGETFYAQLLESAYYISDETLTKMEALAKQAVLFDHPILGLSEDMLGTQLNKPILEMVKYLNNKLGYTRPVNKSYKNNLETMSLYIIESIMRDNMQGEYKRNNMLVDDLHIITKQKSEGEHSSCAAGFYQEFSNLYGIIITFKRYGQAIHYKPDAELESKEEEVEKTNIGTPGLGLRSNAKEES
ncbi:Uncharacterised protein [Legionella lansingensis]|uniref:Uncharacterized protein n=1 Tax=Legionella lansingensis TaxID=45067 RepID=A0A0W0VV78_9GAMM|nr:hypothetical protein [Legionella lansingensis]KTD23801.1 hypothetical protein Llan_0582 [Legionella lansingensis]SNV46977.1 Uncharacterised protein [Legionella lansingensis]